MDMNEHKYDGKILETLSGYRARTRGFMLDSLQGECPFHTHPDLIHKVDENGAFRPFPGDTVVFDIGNEAKASVAQMQELLYERIGCMLSEKLAPDTFHVTLHDLNNDKPYDELIRAMEKSEKEAKVILNYAGREQAGGSVCVRTVSAFNMMNKSIVLGLEPVDEYSCRRLMELYERFQSVVHLNYPLTLHITLAYYKPGEYSVELRNAMKQAFAEITDACGWEFILDEKALWYQRFDDMNRYYNR